MKLLEKHELIKALTKYIYLIYSKYNAYRKYYKTFLRTTSAWIKGVFEDEDRVEEVPIKEKKTTQIVNKFKKLVKR